MVFLTTSTLIDLLSSNDTIHLSTSSFSPLLSIDGGEVRHRHYNRFREIDDVFLLSLSNGPPYRSRRRLGCNEPYLVPMDVGPAPGPPSSRLASSSVERLSDASCSASCFLLDQDNLLDICFDYLKRNLFLLDLIFDDCRFSI